MVFYMKSLIEIGSKYPSSKNKYGFIQIYEKYFKDIKDQKLNILEIGIDKGDSLRIWRDYFPNAKICGLDIDKKDFHINGVEFFFGDQSDKDFLNSIIDKYNKFDIIIDDGSHNIRDQIISFNILFRKLIKHGMYVIEDASQYKAMKNLNLDNLKFGSKEILFSIIKGNFNERKYLSKDDIKKLGSKIKKIHVKKGKFTQKGINISEIIFVEKL